jgi:hypothetical protein
MSEQSAKNHARYVPLWHYLTPVIWLALLIGSIINLCHSDEHTHYSAALIVGINLLLVIFYWYTRAFALRAQDRAIRAEENFRHYLLTGKPLPSELRMGQIIALRFASNEELPALATRAVAEKLTSKQIKEAIKNWKTDHYRV